MTSLTGFEKGPLISETDILKKLSDTDIPAYLKSVKERLNNLSRVLDSEGDGFVSSYVNIIHDNMECLDLKYQMRGDDKVDFPLTIIANDSGFPSEKDFFLLEKNKEDAKRVLEILPNREEIIDRIRKAVLRNGSPAGNQMLLRRHNFYSKLSESRILSGYFLREAQLMKRKEEKSRRRFYTLEWTCLERASKIPVLYKMYLSQDEKHDPLDKVKNPRLETIIYRTQMMGVDLSSFASLVDNEIEEVHPKLLERYRIGPFYSAFTNNSQKMDDLLKKDSNGNSSILKFTVEKVVSEGIREYGSWLEKVLGKKTEREIFTPVDSEEKIITSFRIKQELSGKDENGNPCRVYGATMGGSIV